MKNSTHNTLKKYGRRVAGSYGRPGTRKMKRAASKAARRGNTSLWQTVECRS